ncbi:MAG: hypothetical protein MSS60_03745 [Clostridiales bacterium]|nr:hypothetical protein [Clostridiales bacterium]
MIDKKQYQRAFGVLHASGDFLKEDFPMKQTNHFPARKLIILCAAVILLLSTSIICYAEDVGGIRRTIQLWIHGDQTTAVMDIQNGEYTLTYHDADGTPREQVGGGVVVNPDGSERPMTDEEIMERVMKESRMPEVDFRKDGSTWVYYMDQAMDITDKFDDDSICFVQLKNGSDILYLTVKYQDGFATSPDGFVQPEEFN